MTTTNNSNRRQLLASVIGVSVAGLAGCFGSDDDSEEPTDDSADDSTDDADEPTDPTADLSDEEVAEMVAADVATLLADGDVDHYNQFLHSEGNLEPIESGDESFFGPDFEIVASEVTEREDDQIGVEITVKVEQLDELLETTWELDIRQDGADEWGLWDIETDKLHAEPALSPEAVVEEFVDALAAGQTDTVNALLAEDGTVPETIESAPEEFEGIIDLEETTVQQRDDGQAQIDATVRYDTPEAEETDRWELYVAVVDGEWAIGWVR